MTPSGIEPATFRLVAPPRAPPYLPLMQNTISINSCRLVQTPIDHVDCFSTIKTFSRSLMELDTVKLFIPRDCWYIHVHLLVSPPHLTAQCTLTDHDLTLIIAQQEKLHSLMRIRRRNSIEQMPLSGLKPKCVVKYNRIVSVKHNFVYLLFTVELATRFDPAGSSSGLYVNQVMLENSVHPWNPNNVHKR